MTSQNTIGIHPHPDLDKKALPFQRGQFLLPSNMSYYISSSLSNVPGAADVHTLAPGAPGKPGGPAAPIGPQEMKGKQLCKGVQ